MVAVEFEFKCKHCENCCSIDGKRYQCYESKKEISLEDPINDCDWIQFTEDAVWEEKEFNFCKLTVENFALKAELSKAKESCTALSK